MKHGKLCLLKRAFPSVLTNTAKPECLMHESLLSLISFVCVLWHMATCGITECLAYFPSYDLNFILVVIVTCCSSFKF